jgi:hypothetical protein
MLFNRLIGTACQIRGQTGQQVYSQRSNAMPDLRASFRSSWVVWLCRGVVVLTLGGSGLMFGLEHFREAQTEQALAELQKAGGFFARDDGSRRRPVISIDLDADIVYDSGVVRKRGHVTDETLRLLGHFPELRELSVSGADITDTGLVSLRGLKALERLNLAKTRLTDAAIGPLKDLPGLRMIDLRGTQLTPAGARTLQSALPRAEVLVDAVE